VLTRYHVTNPQEFFTGQNFWKVPADPTKTGTTGGAQPPYFLLAALPGQGAPTFQTTSALTFAKGDGLAAMFSASYDVDGNSALSLYPLPPTSSNPGPNQAQTNFNNDEAIATKLTQVRGSSGTSGAAVTYGNLLILPIGGVGGGLLYIEPVYLQSQSGTAPFPTLQLIFASYDGKVVYGSTVADVVQALTGQTAPPTVTSPTQGAPPPAVSAQVDAAVKAIQAAITELHAAQKADDFVRIGRAQAQLEAAVHQFELAQAAAQQPSPSPSSSPVPSGSPSAPS